LQSLSIKFDRLLSFEEAIVMRTLVVAISILAASLSAAASAEFSMDHGSAEAATQAASDASAAAAAKASAIASGGPLLPSQKTNFSVGSASSFKAVVIRRTPEELKAFEDGKNAWTARCKPTVVEDAEKLRRVKYAEPDCDLSAFNTAGAE
jgi:hypothetical protein